MFIFIFLAIQKLLLKINYDKKKEPQNHLQN